MKTHTAKARIVIPSPPIVAWAKSLIDDIGIPAAVEQTGLSRAVLLGIAAGVGVQRGSIALAEAAKSDVRSA
jgi:hypothetical protein